MLKNQVQEKDKIIEHMEVSARGVDCLRIVSLYLKTIGIEVKKFVLTLNLYNASIVRYS